MINFKFKITICYVFFVLNYLYFIVFQQMRNVVFVVLTVSWFRRIFKPDESFFVSWENVHFQTGNYCLKPFPHRLLISINIVADSNPCQVTRRCNIDKIHTLPTLQLSIEVALQHTASTIHCLRQHISILTSYFYDFSAVFDRFLSYSESIHSTIRCRNEKEDDEVKYQRKLMFH